MEGLSILFGVPFWSVMIFLWIRRMRRTKPPRWRRITGALFFIGFPVLAAVSLSKYMFIDEPLFFAAANGKVQEAKALFAWGADANVDFNGTTPLVAAAEQGNGEMVRLLLAHGAYLNEPSDWPRRTALQAAQENGWIEVVRILKQAGAK